MDKANEDWKIFGNEEKILDFLAQYGENKSFFFSGLINKQQNKKHGYR